MHAIANAISTIRNSIPLQILNAGFLDQSRDFRFGLGTNLDEQIRTQLIIPRILVDLNIVGGTEVEIPVSQMQRLPSDPGESVFRVPKSVTQNRSIITPLCLVYVSRNRFGAWGYGAQLNYGQLGNLQDHGSIMTSAAGMMQAIDNVVTPSNAECRLIGENVIMVREGASIPATSSIRVVLANDENLNNLQTRTILPFRKLCVLAAKSYLYNTLIVTVDTAKLQGGAEIGRFLSVLESYSDAEENYQTYLSDVWRAVAKMNDRESYRRLMKVAIGGYR
jgi:hypothetical protein